MATHHNAEASSSVIQTDRPARSNQGPDLMVGDRRRRPAEAAPAASLTVAVVSFHRPEQVRRLVGRLDEIRPPVSLLRWDRIIIVDNSPEGELLAIDLGAGQVPIIVLHEPTPGIAAARNAALNAADTEYLAFIDDDELPADDWLIELAQATSAHPEALAIMGPVEYRFAEPPPPWLVESRVFEVVSLAEREAPPYLDTGNVMFRTELRTILDPVFDERFGLMGGSDYQLGLRMAAAGLSLCAAPDAIVEELVTPERMTQRWVRRRMRRYGSTLAAANISLHTRQPKRVFVRAEQLARGLARIGLGVGLLARSVTGSTPRWSAVRQLCLGAGQICASLGVPVVEYGRDSDERPVDGADSLGPVTRLPR